MDKTTEKLIKLGIIVAILVLITCGVSVALFSISRIMGNNKIVQAQIEVLKTQQENIGKPIIYEQHFSKMDK